MSLSPQTPTSSNSSGSITSCSSPDDPGHSTSLGTDASPTPSSSTASSDNNSTALSADSSTVSQPQSKVKSKGKKRKKGVSDGDGGDGSAVTEKAIRRTRVEWNNFPLTVAKLQAKLAKYQALNARTQQEDRTKIKDGVADEILADEQLRKMFQARKISDADIRLVRGHSHYILRDPVI